MTTTKKTAARIAEATRTGADTYDVRYSDSPKSYDPDVNERYLHVLASQGYTVEVSAWADCPAKTIAAK